MVTLAFFFLATSAMIGALAVVTARNIFYAALGLLVSLAAVAGIYITLDADFLALAQFLIYVGGIAVLIVFAVMMTAQINRASSSHRLWPLGLLTGAATLAGLAYVMISTEWRSEGRGETISPMVGDAASPRRPPAGLAVQHVSPAVRVGGTAAACGDDRRACHSAAAVRRGRHDGYPLA